MKSLPSGMFLPDPSAAVFQPENVNPGLVKVPCAETVKDSPIDCCA